MKSDTLWMADERVSLTDEQREEVRLLLSQFGAKQAKKKSAGPKIQVGPDPFKNAPPGKTITLDECGASTRKYQMVRETKITFLPVIFDNIELTKEDIFHMIDRLGVTRQDGDGLVIISSVAQADPIRIMHVQTEQVGLKTFKVTAVRFVT